MKTSAERVDQSPLPLIEAWENLTEFLLPDMSRFIGTAEIVDGLISRSLLERELDQHSPVPSEWLVRVREADKRFRRAAPRILEFVPLGLYHDEFDNPSHWWWRTEEIVLGEAASNLLSVSEAADLKGVHPHTIRRAIANAEVPARRLANGFLVRRRDVERWAPRPVGRPSAKQAEGDPVLEAFNAANLAADFDRAHELAEVIRAHPTSPRRYLAVAIDALNQGEFSEALTWVRKAITRGLPTASASTASIVKAWALLGLGAREEALTTLTAAKRLPGSNWQLEAALIDTWIALDRPKEAAKVARDALGQYPGVSELLFLAARAEWHSDLTWDALEHVVRFRAAEEGSIPAALLHGSILGYLGDKHEDRDAYQQALGIFESARSDGGAEAERLFGITLARLGRWKKALTSARRLLADEEGRDSAVTVCNSVVIQAANTDSEDLERILDSVEALVGPSELTRLERGILATVNGDVDGVYSALGVTPARLRKADWRAHYLLGGALVAAGRSSEAADMLSRVRELLPKPEGLLMLAQAAVASNRHRMARDVLREVATMEGPSAVTADVASALLESADAEAAALVLGSHLSMTDVASYGAAAGERWVKEDRAAPESTWEGVHPVMSPILQGTISPYSNN